MLKLYNYNVCVLLNEWMSFFFSFLHWNVLHFSTVALAFYRKKFVSSGSFLFTARMLKRKQKLINCFLFTFCELLLATNRLKVGNRYTYIRKSLTTSWKEVKHTKIRNRKTRNITFNSVQFELNTNPCCLPCEFVYNRNWFWKKGTAWWNFVFAPSSQLNWNDFVLKSKKNLRFQFARNE